jgi:hypothetical protein
MNGTVFEKQLLNKMCVLNLLLLLSEIFLLKDELSVLWSQLCNGTHVKYVSFLTDFNEIWILLTGFHQILKTSYFMETHLVVAELFHATDRQKCRN